MKSALAVAVDDKSPAETSRASGSDLVIEFSGFLLGVSGNLASPKHPTPLRF
jgi:hypothetical protein